MNIDFVAHRGWSSNYPENTLISIKEAIAVGAKFIEFDVQISKDGVPMVIHDSTLDRVSGKSGTIMEMTAKELSFVSAHFPVRFGDKYLECHIPSLAEVVDLLNKSPWVKSFVEVKRHSPEKFGDSAVLEAVIKDMRKARFSWNVISFRKQVLECAKSKFKVPVGFILREYDNANKRQLDKLLPEFAIVDIEVLPDLKSILWKGPWQWIVYGVDKFDDVEPMKRLGAGFIGCDDIETFLTLSDSSRDKNV